MNTQLALETTFEDCIDIRFHSEHGRTPKSLTVVIPELYTPDEFLEFINEYYDRCHADGVFESVTWLLNHGVTVTDNVHFEYTPEYTYDVSMFPEATHHGDADVMITIDNKVDEPQTFNLANLTRHLARSLA